MHSCRDNPRRKLQKIFQRKRSRVKFIFLRTEYDYAEKCLISAGNTRHRRGQKFTQLLSYYVAIPYKRLYEALIILVLTYLVVGRVSIKQQL